MRTVLNLGVNLVGCWDAEQWDWGWSWPLCVSPLQHGEGQTSPHSPFVPLRALLGKQGFIILWPLQIPGNATTCQCPSTAGIGIPIPNNSPRLDLFPLLPPNGSLTPHQADISLLLPTTTVGRAWRSLGDGYSCSASQTGSIPAEMWNFMFARCSFGHPSLN